MRVKTKIGYENVLVVAPHGPDELNTAEIAEIIAKEIDGHLVANLGWKKQDRVDTAKDQADCNKLSHLNHHVLSDEVLDPICRAGKRMLGKKSWGTMLVVRGFKSPDKKKSFPKIVIGYGAGAALPTAKERHSKLFCYSLLHQGMEVGIGQVGGLFAGNDPDGLNKFFQSIDEDEICSFQIGIHEDWRANKKTAPVAGAVIGSAVREYLALVNSHNNYPKDLKQILGLAEVI